MKKDLSSERRGEKETASLEKDPNVRSGPPKSNSPSFSCVFSNVVVALGISFHSREISF